MNAYRVGQKLWRHDINGDRRGGPTRVTVTKVGRKLVTVASYGRDETFRIDTGRTNDQYQHGWLCTDAEHADHIARGQAMERLRAHHIRFDHGGYEHSVSVEVLNAIADLLDDGEPA